MLKIYGCENTRSFRALWTAAEADVDCEYVRLDLAKGEARNPDFLALNPGGKVPTLVDGDLRLTESLAICDYLASLAPDKHLAPTAAPQRALYLQWCSFAVTELEQPLWTHAKHRFALPPQHRVPAVLEVVPYEFGRALKVLSAGLAQHPYILGNRFSVADILIAQSLQWAQGANFSLEHENIGTYVARCAERPAFVQAKGRQASARVQ